MQKISGKVFDEERALYHLTDAEVSNCTFAGPADGESALKEARNVAVSDCRFSLRYPFWHTEGFRMSDCFLDSAVRAPLWYAKSGTIDRCRVDGVKCLRECEGISMKDCEIVSSEFGWRCRDLSFSDCQVTSEYFLFETRTAVISGLKLHGKYSFQYTENLSVEHSELNTKDAFWHSKNVTVHDCTVRGEYLGWYSDGLTLIDCRIQGTQPLCYCKNLKLVNCTMEGCDLSFEYSDVDAQISGHVDSVKNPRSGRICADSCGEVILENSVVETDCEIVIREK